MGNCCGTSSSNHEIQQQQRNYIPPEDFQDHKQEEEDDENNIIHDHVDDDEVHDVETTSTTRSNTPPFVGTPLNDDITKATTTILPLVDPRLVSLLDFFRQLYARRIDIYNRIIPVHRQDLETIFGEMGKVQKLEKRNRSSKMGGVMRQRSLSVGNENEMKDERFKVKPIDSGGVIQPPPTDGKGGAPSKPKK